MPINLLPKKFKEREKKEIRKKDKVNKSVEMRVLYNKPKTDENKKSKGNIFSNFFYPLFFRGEKASNKINDKEKQRLLEEKKRKEIADFLKDKKNIELNHKKGSAETRVSELDTDNKKKVFVDKKIKDVNKEKDNIKKQSFWQWLSGRKPSTDSQENKILSNSFNKAEDSAKNIKKLLEEKSFWQREEIKKEKSFLNGNNQASPESKKKGEQNINKKNKDTDKKGSFWQRLFFNIGKDNKKDSHIAHESQIMKKNKNSKTNKKKKKTGGSGKNKKKGRIKKFFQKKTEINFIDGELIGSVKLKIKERALSIIFVSFFSLIIVSSIYMLVNWYQLTIIERSNNVEKKLQDLKGNIDIYEAKKQKALEFQKKLKAINYLLDHHICWANFFDELEDVTLKNVYYQSANIDFNGNVSLEAEADSFRTIAEQLLIFQEKKNLIESVEIDSADSETIGGEDSQIKTVRFHISLKINKEIFFNKDK